jgi:hypothetical protein
MKYLPITNTQLSILNVLLVGSLVLTTSVNLDSTYAISDIPTSNTIKTNIDNSLELITENVSSSITDTIDKVIADSLDGVMESTINLLVKNATGDNNNLSDVSFDPKIPSGIDIS